MSFLALSVHYLRNACQQWPQILHLERASIRVSRNNQLRCNVPRFQTAIEQQQLRPEKKEMSKEEVREDGR
jgi:hypothetical protein